MGPGFLESIYENALILELKKRGIKAENQVEVPVLYDGVEVGKHRLDLLVEDTVIVELKAVKELDDIFYVILKSYMKATGKRSALLMNFAKAVLDVKRVFPQS